MTPEEFKELLKIDKNQLDEELMRQPMLFQEVSDHYVTWVAARDEAKESLTMVDAELDAEIRKELEDQKVTEAVVKNRIQVDKKHKRASDKYLTVKKTADRYAAVKEAFHMRAYMLRELANLYVTGYFETSSVQGTSRTDSAVYKRQRQRLAEARGKSEQ